MACPNNQTSSTRVDMQLLNHHVDSHLLQNKTTHTFTIPHSIGRLTNVHDEHS